MKTLIFLNTDMQGLKKYNHAIQCFVMKHFDKGIYYLINSSEEGYFPAHALLHYFYHYKYYQLLNISNESVICAEENKILFIIRSKSIHWLKEHIREKAHLSFMLGYLHHHGLGVKKDYQMALTYYRLTSNTQTIFHQHLLAECFRKMMKYQESLNFMTHLCQQTPEQAPFLYTLALTYKSQRNFEMAFVKFEALIRLEPTFANGWYRWAEALYQGKYYDEAVLKLKQALCLNPENVTFLELSAKVAYAQRKYLAALEFIERAEKLDPHHAEIRNIRKKYIDHLEQLCRRKYRTGAITLRLKRVTPTLDLRHYPRDSAFINRLCHLIRDPNTHLITLRLPKITDAEFSLLLEATKHSLKLTSVTFDPILLVKNANNQQLLNAYLYRNKLFQKKQISAQDLRALNISILSAPELRETLTLLLTRHSYLDILDFSNKNVTGQSFLLEPKNFPNHPNLIELNLSNNELGNDGIKKLCLLLKTSPPLFPNLRRLNLSNNQIGDIGMRALIELLRAKLDREGGHSLRKLSTINLNDNFITSVTNLNSLLHQIKIDHPSSQVIISLSNNMICPTESKKQNVVLGENSLFLSKPRYAKSYIEPKNNYPITPKNCLIFLARTKGRNPFGHHIMLYLEGMKNNGQHYVVRYHIISLKPKVAHVRIEPCDMTKLREDRHKFDFIRTYEATSEQGTMLHHNIHQQKNLEIPYSRFTHSTDSAQNCLIWSLEQLKKIGITEPAPILGIPCLVMTAN